MLKSLGYMVSILTRCIYEKEAKIKGLDFVAIDTYEEYQERNDKLNDLLYYVKWLKEYSEFNRKYYGSDRTYKEYNIISEQCRKEDLDIVLV